MRMKESMMKIAMNKLISVLLIVMLVLSSTVTCFADETAEAVKAEESAEEQLKQKEAEKKAEAKAKEEEEAKAKAEAEAKAKAEAEAKAKAEAEAREQQKQEEEAKAEPEAEAPADTGQPQAAQKSEVDDNSPASPAEASAVQDDDNTVLDAASRSKKAKHLDATLSDGTYRPDAFSFTGGTGKVQYTCVKVIINNGNPWGLFETSSDSQTHIYRGNASKEGEINELYNPTTKAMGEGVVEVGSKQFVIPIELNQAFDVSARTVAMSVPKWIAYSFTVSLSDTAEKISDDSTIPGVKPDGGGQDGSGSDEQEKKEPSKTKTLKDGTYKVKATTCRVMFYLYPKEKDPAKVILVKKNGKMTATITLTGSGYDYVYMGTPKQAKKAGKSKWIKAKKVNGYYTFKIPVAKLDKKLNITPHSSKYASDGDPSTEPWRPDKWIMFYSSGAKKVKDGAAIKTKGKAKDRNAKSGKKNAKAKNDGKAASQSKYKDDSAKSTSAVNNSTGLKDGVYTPDRFSWSGGSGRLAYIRCNKITVRGGKAIATIEFSSSKYDSLKANGRVYSKSGGGNSTFNIPVKLNANNTIIGRTTAMSQPHWIKYNIYIYKKGADGGKNGKTAEDGDDGHTTQTKKLSSKAPDLMGLEFDKEIKVEHAKYFKIYKYEQGITLIEVDQASDTALYKEEKQTKKGSDTSSDDKQEAIEYDEDGKPIAKSQNEITEELYHNNVVNYLIVPEKVDIPAGLEKDCIIITQPVKKGYVAAPSVIENMDELGVLDAVSTLGMEEKDIRNKTLAEAVKDEKVKALGAYEKPDYAQIIKDKTDLALFPADVLPDEVKKAEGKTGKEAAGSVEKAKKEAEEKKEILETLQRRFSALAVPMLVDRSGDEASNYAEAEWIKVYGAIYGEEEKAAAAFEKFTKDNKKEKLKK